ncbi:MAG: hypothetical protein HQM08_27300 [Candidatus Riflebacteria bacterium]|nr:hypothetical protein [Candidatus Riflebacteria bacterium]
MTDADILRLVKVCDERRTRGGDRKSSEAKSKVPSGTIDNSEPSANKTAETIGTKAHKIKDARIVLTKASPETQKQVESGEKSIRKV